MAPAESTMAGNPACPVPKPSTHRPAHKRPSLKKPETASLASPAAAGAASGKTTQFSLDAAGADNQEPGLKVQSGAAAASGNTGSEPIMISPFSNYTGGSEEHQVEQARIKALSRSFGKREQSRMSHLEVVEEADKEGDSGEEGDPTVNLLPTCGIIHIF